MTSTAAPHPSNGLTWFKSSYSGSAGGNCVEVAACPSTTRDIRIRDSKNPDGPVLTLGAAAWGAFVTDVIARP
ncbi:DUF397 domain-containing protein [Streptomyces noursei]|uniref:DUF397 domain-containing protein n=1 Tax=Streptomyces noursei TaxID=1971 RepID=UPI00167A6526|nr:DUF397 domain-containing protein [Streptomyces noursei]MCZ1018177.1 DUF397 domain-containing protein [Streptomyces noursei]GGW87156.1 hypothetical protein GCM10010341_04470 [Streptomyces noursei]